MRYDKKITHPKGFTLLEVLVALVLIVIGISAAVAAVSTGKFFLKQAENKAEAMRAVLVKMEEYLAKSYSDLEPGGPLRGTLGKITWQVNVTQKYEGTEPPIIPYKHLESIAFYNETDKAGNIYQKNVRLENIVAYPFIHTASTWISRDLAGSSEVPYSPNSDNFVGAKTIGDKVTLKVNLKYEVAKEFLIIYNVAIVAEDATGIGAMDTVLTGCFMDNFGPKPVVTRTPIITQPLISNVIALTGSDALSPGEHTIEIRWCKDTTHGRIMLREANLMVVAVEKAP